MSPLEKVQEAVFQHIERIGVYFKPGAKITVLVRFPDKPDADFIVTTDELGDVRSNGGSPAARRRHLC